ncbi:MAG: cytochrome C peroxidase, partial [Rhizobium sp.]|nr:cytochrome C peroxidase [Rhizobium sp.]
MKKIITSIAVMLLASTAFAADPAPADLRASALEIFKPLPSTTPAVANNPITPDKIALGKALF